MAKVAYKCGKCGRTLVYKKEPTTPPNCCSAPMSKVQAEQSQGSPSQQPPTQKNVGPGAGGSSTQPK